WTGAEVQEEPHLDVRPALNRLLFYCIPSAAADRKASTSGATSSYVAKRNRVGALLLPLLKALVPEGIMADDDAASSVDVSRPRPSSGLVPLFRDVFGDAIHADFFLLFYSRLKGYEEKVSSLTGLEFQVSTLKKQVSRLNDKLSSS
nr:hypothetical protein [Tanacetum cinerariifolium]